MAEEARVFAISDLHLPGGADKAMDVFGEQWSGHFERIAQDWQQRVGEGDVVLLPGDISWALRFEEAKADLQGISALPGQKVLIRGNHDFWWESLSRLRAFLPPGMHALQNDALRVGDLVFAGSRGWTAPEGEEDAENAKIYRRELLRLEMSLTEARRLGPGLRLYALAHYPPSPETGESTPVTRIMARYGVSDVVYGHLHGPAAERAFSGCIEGVRYHPVSCDRLDFRLLELPRAAS